MCGRRGHENAMGRRGARAAMVSGRCSSEWQEWPPAVLDAWIYEGSRSREDSV